MKCFKVSKRPDFVRGPVDGGVVDPALIRSMHGFDGLVLVGDAIDGAEELKDFGRGKADGRTV